MGWYRYGFQGMEADNEVKGDGNSYTTHFRQLDPRVGRWLSIDPKASSLSWQSPYCSMDNNPILYNDVLGDWVKVRFSKKAKKNGGIATLKKTFKTEYNLDVEFKKTLFGYKMQLSKSNSGEIKGKAAQEWAKVLNRESKTKGVGVDNGKQVNVVFNFVYDESDKYNYRVDGGFVFENIQGTKNIGYVDLADFNSEGILDISQCKDCNISSLPKNAQKSQWALSKVLEHEFIGHAIMGLPDYENRPTENQSSKSKTASGIVNKFLKKDENWNRVNYKSKGEKGGTSTMENNSTGEKINVKYRPTAPDEK